MWHRFDDDLKRTILHAAQHKNSEDPKLATRHLLTQLLVESAAASQVLARIGVAPASVTKELERTEESECLICDSDTALTVQARAAVEHSYELAAELGDSSIGCLHLLIALVREPTGSSAGRALTRLGVTWERAGRALMALQRGRLCAPSGVRVPGLRARKVKHWLRRGAGHIKRLAYAAVHCREPFLPYLVARKRAAGNPYPHYTRLRRRPIYWEPLTERWLVTGYKDVVAALAEPGLSQRIFEPSDGTQGELPPWVQREFRHLQGVFDHQMVFRNAPTQTRQRSLVAKRFTPRVIERMRDQMQGVADNLLDAAAPLGRMEVIAELAVPFPLLVIVQMLGLPPDLMVRFKKWSADYVMHLSFNTTLAQDLTTYHSVLEATAYFRARIAERRPAPQDDLITLLLQPDAQGEQLPEEQVVANCLLLLAAGHENTTRIIGSGLLALLRRTDQWLRLRENPSLIGPAVEEVLRYDSPVQWALRCLPEDLHWRGHALKKGQWVQIGIGAANRDPAQFPDPDRLDITRAENRHVAFGQGPHFCLGAALARMEAQVVLGALAARFPRLRLERSPDYDHDGLGFRGPLSLHVRWDGG